jgi:hypothetical protein
MAAIPQSTPAEHAARNKEIQAWIDRHSLTGSFNDLKQAWEDAYFSDYDFNTGTTKPSEVTTPN